MNITEKIRAHFRKSPNADVKKAAEKFAQPISRIYKLRKEVREGEPVAAAPAPKRGRARKIVVTASQLEIAKKLGINPAQYVKEVKKITQGKWQPPAALPVPPAPNTDTWIGAVEGDNIVATLTERGTRYGKFKDHADVTQKLKFIIRQHMGERYERMEPDQIESIEMICHKLGRIANGDFNYNDSWVDIAGYAKLVSDRLGGVER